MEPGPVLPTPGLRLFPGLGPVGCPRFGVRVLSPNPGPTGVSQCCRNWWGWRSRGVGWAAAVGRAKLWVSGRQGDPNPGVGSVG